MPPELYGLISEIVRKRSPNDFVASPELKKMLSYTSYWKVLKRYCQECGITSVATHGLRHSTSGIYPAFGAKWDDIFHLFKHSSPSVAERYLQDKGENASKVAASIRLFDGSNQCSNIRSSFLVPLSSDAARNGAPSAVSESHSEEKTS